MAKEERIVHVKVNSNVGVETKKTKGLSKELKQTEKTGTSAFSKLDKLSGGFLGRIRSLIPSVSKLSFSFKALKVAIASTGIGLLVMAVVSLREAFSRSEAGQNKMAKIMGVLGAVTGQLMDKLADFGESIISVFENPKKAMIDFKNALKENIINRFEGLLELIPNLSKAVTQLFKGNFSEAGKIATDAVGKVALGVDSVTDSIENATNSISDFVAETEKEMAIMGKIMDSRADIDKRQRQLNIDRAKADAEISELRSKVEDAENYTALERLEFSKQAQKKQQDIIDRKSTRLNSSHP